MVYTALLYVRPSNAKMKASYSLLGLTVASGAALVVVSHASILQTCITGLLFVGFTLVGTLLASRKLAMAKQKIDR